MSDQTDREQDHAIAQRERIAAMYYHGTKDYRVNYDEHVACRQCGYRYQLLDWSCAAHTLTCGVQAVPTDEAERITASAAAHGVTVRFEGRA